MHSLKKPGEKCISITVNSIWIALDKRRFELYLKLAHALWIDKLGKPNAISLYPVSRTLLQKYPQLSHILALHTTKLCKK